MLRRVIRAFQRHGLREFVRLLAHNIRYHARHLFRSAAPDPVERSFDEAHGIETSKIREIGSLDIDSPNAAEAVRYQPSDIELARRAIQASGIEHPDFVFVDFGCGKGRVMILAAEFPFRRILGIEFSPELARIARENIAACRDRLTGCRDLQAIQADAAVFEPPDEPLVCYFYNPFGESVMRGVVSNIERSLRKRWRKIFVIYVDARHRKIFDEGTLWRPVKEDQQYLVYETPPSPPMGG